MFYRQYTKCYQHAPGDKPFNQSDLASFVGGAAAPGLAVAILSFLSGANVIGFIAIAVTYAATIVAVANQWLYHRLVCLEPDGSPPKCAMGVVESDPEVAGLGEFDNDDFFDLRLMPHRPKDEYAGPDNAYGTGNPGPSKDGKTELHPANDVYLDKFQGEALIKPSIAGLPYETSRSILHCESEGNFWQAMKDYALLLGVAVGLGAAGGAALGAAAGCAISGIFGPIGCLIGAIIGAIAGAIAGAAAGAYIGATIAFHSDPGDVEEENVGDHRLGPIKSGDRVMVLGRHVYDGFHEGWHEIHPLMAIMKIDSRDTSQYLEWDPDFLGSGMALPADNAQMPNGIRNLDPAKDMAVGLESKKFRERAEWLLRKWCLALQEAFDPLTRAGQLHPVNRWAVHPAVDGCLPAGDGPPPLH